MAPVERPPFDTSAVTDSVDDAGVEAAAVEETDDDVNRSPDSISGREKIRACLLWQERMQETSTKILENACFQINCYHA